MLRNRLSNRRRTSAAFCLCWATAGLAAAAPNDVQSEYYRHVIFDNSEQREIYWHSTASATAPSTLAGSDSRLPVESTIFHTPPNALRLEWQSQPKGGWDAEIHPVNFPNRFPDLSGNILFFWVYAPEAIAVRYPATTTARSTCQWLCHVDDLGLDPRLSMQASVLYLFKDEALGGTSFYAPIRSDAEIAAFYRDAKSLSGEAFTQQYGIRAGYMHESNDYFARIGRISVKWNRLIFYDRTVHHSGDITAPDWLSEDPLAGRLTLNGFFTCRRNLG